MKILVVEDERYNIDFKDDVAVIDNVNIEYVNYDGNCNDDSSETLKIRTENNGIARYLVIETEKFSISSIEDFVEILNDFCNRAGIKK